MLTHPPKPSIRIKLYSRTSWVWDCPGWVHFQHSGVRWALTGVGLCCWAAFTSRAHQGGVHSLASVPAAGFVKGQALLAGPRYDFRVPSQVFGSTQRLDAVDSPAVGVRHVERAGHGVHSQVVLVCRVVASGEEAQRGVRRRHAAGLLGQRWQTAQRDSNCLWCLLGWPKRSLSFPIRWYGNTWTNFLAQPNTLVNWKESNLVN